MIYSSPRPLENVKGHPNRVTITRRVPLLVTIRIRLQSDYKIYKTGNYMFQQTKNLNSTQHFEVM
jgi:hypothetical protein